MTIETNIGLIFWDTVSGIIKNLPWFILIYFGIKTIAKQMPKWIEIVFKEMQKAKVLDKAIQRNI